ncbi:MAG: hypothetical protein N5P05_004563 (plasmid) [Chroococcopsis gigantea SAG 12.99]|jgi:prophage antirepressor-like protein|nr:hypothetical protein [Chroococcopsis gigantea SAG 12.99]
MAGDKSSVRLIKNISHTLARFDGDEKGIGIAYTLGGEQELLTTTEPGLYWLIFQSRQPVAKRSQRWLLGQTLPSF